MYCKTYAKERTFGYTGSSYKVALPSETEVRFIFIEHPRSDLVSMCASQDSIKTHTLFSDIYKKENEDTTEAKRKLISETIRDKVGNARDALRSEVCFTLPKHVALSGLLTDYLRVLDHQEHVRCQPVESSGAHSHYR